MDSDETNISLTFEQKRENLQNMKAINTEIQRLSGLRRHFGDINPEESDMGGWTENKSELV